MSPLSVAKEFLRVALADVRYQRARSILAVTGVGLAVATLVGLWGLNAGYQQALQSGIDKLGFHVLVTAKGCPYEAATVFLRGGIIPMYIDHEKQREVERDPAVDALTPLFLGPVIDKETGRSRLFMGIDKTYVSMKNLRYQRGKWFSGKLVSEAIVGYTVAEYMDLKLGDPVPIPGKGRVLKLVGVLDRTGTQDDGTVFLPLGLAQQVFDKKDKLTGLGVRLKDPSLVPDFVARVYEIPSLQPITMSQVTTTIIKLIESARAFVAAVAAVALLLAVILVMNVMLMSVMERISEFGVMRAMGASRSDLFLLVATEAMLACSFGGLLGVGIALAGQFGVETLARRHLAFAPWGDLIAISPFMVLEALACSVTVGLLASLYPALRAASLRPVQAIRRLP